MSSKETNTVMYLGWLSSSLLYICLGIKELLFNHSVYAYNGFQ